MNAWPPRIGGSIYNQSRKRWRVVAFGIKDGERWVMAVRKNVVALWPWGSVEGGLGHE